MRTAAVAVLVLALAGCGGGSDEGAPPTGAPVAPVAEQVKLDLRTAAIYLEAHKTTDGAYTTDKQQLPAGFPATVTIKSAAGETFLLEARAAGGGRYELRSTAGEESRTCAPVSAECRGGVW